MACFTLIPALCIFTKQKLGKMLPFRSLRTTHLCSSHTTNFKFFGIPIVFLVAVCCIVLAIKLLLLDKTPHETKERSGRMNATITVLIIGVQYVVWNTIGLTLWTMCAYYSLHGRESEDYVMKLLLWGNSNTSLIVNSAVNPVVYICRVKKLKEHIVVVAKCYCLRRSRVAEQRVSRSFRASSVWSNAADPRISQSVRESTFFYLILFKLYSTAISKNQSSKMCFRL